MSQLVAKFGLPQAEFVALQLAREPEFAALRVEVTANPVLVVSLDNGVSSASNVKQVWVRFWAGQGSWLHAGHGAPKATEHLDQVFERLLGTPARLLRFLRGLWHAPVWECSLVAWCVVVSLALLVAPYLLQEGGYEMEDWWVPVYLGALGLTTAVPLFVLLRNALQVGKEEGRVLALLEQRTKGVYVRSALGHDDSGAPVGASTSLGLALNALVQAVAEALGSSRSRSWLAGSTRQLLGGVVVTGVLDGRGRVGHVAGLLLKVSSVEAFAAARGDTMRFAVPAGQVVGFPARVVELRAADLEGAVLLLGGLKPRRWLTGAGLLLMLALAVILMGSRPNIWPAKTPALDFSRQHIPPIPPDSIGTVPVPVQLQVTLSGCEGVDQAPFRSPYWRPVELAKRDLGGDRCELTAVLTPPKDKSIGQFDQGTVYLLRERSLLPGVPLQPEILTQFDLRYALLVYHQQEGRLP